MLWQSPIRRSVQIFICRKRSSPFPWGVVLWCYNSLQVHQSQVGKWERRRYLCGKQLPSNHPSETFPEQVPQNDRYRKAIWLWKRKFPIVSSASSPPSWWRSPWSAPWPSLLRFSRGFPPVRMGAQQDIHIMQMTHGLMVPILAALIVRGSIVGQPFIVVWDALIAGPVSE